MEVSPGKAEKAGRRSDFRGKNYYFCSDECKEQFDKSPERYVKK
jgi:YHS domain-containing protein